MLEQIQLFFSVHPITSVLGVIAICVLVFYFFKVAGINFVDELIFMGLHEFTVDEFPTLEEIRKEMPLGLGPKLEESLPRLVRSGRVEMQDLYGTVQYRVAGAHRKDPPRLTREYN